MSDFSANMNNIKDFH